MTSGELFEMLARATDLSPLIAKSAVRRACERSNIVPANLTRTDLPRLVTELEAAVQTFLEPAHASVVGQRLQALALVTASTPSTKPPRSLTGTKRSSSD
jgi:hypothetical protein